MADISALGPIAALFALPAIEGSVKADIDFAGTLGAPAGRAFIQAERLVWRDFAVDSATLSGSANTERVAIDTLEMVHGRDRITGNGIYHLPSANLQETRLTLKVMDLRPYLSMLASAVDGFDRQMQGFNGSISGSVFLSGPPLRPDGKADLAISGIAFQDRPFGDVVVDVRKQGGRITAKRLNLKRGEDVITVKGVIDLAAESAESLALSARIADIGWYAQVLLPRAWAVSGTVNLDAEASGSLARPEARIRAEFKQLGVGSRIQIDSAALRAHSDGRVIHVDAAASAGADAAVSLSGEAATHWAEDAVVMHVTTCDIQFHDLALSLEQRSRVDYRRDGSISVDRLTLKGPSGSVGLNGTTAPDGPSGLQLEIADLTGAEWFEALVGIPVRFGRLNGAFQLSGELRQPSFSGAGSADRIVIENYPGPLNGEFDFSYTGGGLDVRRLNLRGPAGPDLSVNGNFPVRLTPELALLPGPLEATGRFSLPDLRLVNAFTDRLQVSGGDLHGEFQIGGSWRQPGGRILFRGGAVDLDPRWRPFPPGPFTFQCDLNIEDTHLTIQSLRLDSPSLSASGGGAWKNIPSPAAFIEGNAKRPYGELAVEGKLAIPDLGWLARGVDGLRRTSGRLDADLRLTGSAAEPVFATVIRISDGELQSNVGIPPMRAIQLNARLNAEGLALDRLEAQMGGAPVQASGFLQWGGRADQTAELTVKGTNLLLYRDQDVMLRADTDLRLQGPVARMSLSGEVAVTKGTVKRNLNIFGSLKKPVGPKFESAVRLFSLPEPPLRDMRFDVRLTSRAPIDIRGNIAHGPVRPDLRLGGTGLLPVLTGRVYVDATRLRLPAGRLMIESGLVQFLETDPEVPVLDLKGSARMLGYDINVLVSGHFNEPEITLSSVPPLPGDELMLLLLTGQPPKDTLGRQGKYRQNVQVAVYVAKDLFAGWFPEDSSEGVEDILDRFDFQIGRDVTSSGDETLEAQFRVADGFILDRDQLFITGEKDAYDYINTGIKLVFRFK